MKMRLARYCCQVLKESGTPNRIACVGVREAESTKRKGRDIFSTRGNTYKETLYFSLNHAQEVYKESQEIQDDNWDCTLIANMKKHKETIVNPIYEWTDEEIWEYIAQENIKTNPLYKRGYKRVGCIGCPLASHNMRIKEFKDYPKFEVAYKAAFKKMLEKRKSEGKDDTTGKWKDEQAVFDWWMEEAKYNVKGQMSLFEENE